MLVHLAALARAARQEARTSAEDRELLTELEALLGLRLLDAAAGTLTAAALSLTPAAVATLATANTFFDSAERLSLRQARQRHDSAAQDGNARPAEDAEPGLRAVVVSALHPVREIT